MVLIDRYFPQLDLPCVTSDNHQGGLEATEFLIEKGHKRIACIQGVSDSSSNIDRVLGYREALIKHGIEVDESLISGNSFSENNGYLVAKQVLQMMPRPTAIFSLGNLSTFGALRAIREEGLSVPEDISLISFDDDVYSAFLNPPMTTVAQQKESIGQLAVKLLCEQAFAGKISESIVLPTRLIKRESVRALTI